MDIISVIIPSYNTKDITLTCLNSLDVLLRADVNIGVSFEIYIVDNASQDGSAEAVHSFILNKNNNRISYRIIPLPVNLGFSKANNVALKEVRGTYVLFLNSDVMVNEIDFKKLISYFDASTNVAALTVKVSLADGRIDPASHRGFPTIWRSFCYFSKLEYILGKMPILNVFFGGYHLMDKNLKTIHEIDSPSGAFYLVRKSILDTTGGFDEKFFMYGEDLDLAYRIKEKNYSVIYYPGFEVVHLKYQSGLQKDKKVARAIKRHFYEAMEIFYKKHYEPKYNFVVNSLVYLLINLKEIFS